MIATRRAGFLLILASLSTPLLVSAANNPYEIDINELERKGPAAPKKEAHPKKPKAQPKKAPKPIIFTNGFAKYTVQESDYRARLLAKHLGISEEELQRLLPEIFRLNGISSLSQLEIGQTLLVPLPPRPKPPAEPEEAPDQSRAPAPATGAFPGSDRQ